MNLRNYFPRVTNLTLYYLTSGVLLTEFHEINLIENRELKKVYKTLLLSWN